jgi:hypothetical protein
MIPRKLILLLASASVSSSDGHAEREQASLNRPNVNEPHNFSVIGSSSASHAPKRGRYPDAIWQSLATIELGLESCW